MRGVVGEARAGAAVDAGGALPRTGHGPVPASPPFLCADPGVRRSHLLTTSLNHAHDMRILVMDGMPMHASRGDTGNDDLHMQRTLDDHGMRHF